jgi:hypothetical protein
MFVHWRRDALMLALVPLAALLGACGRNGGEELARCRASLAMAHADLKMCAEAEDEMFRACADAAPSLPWHESEKPNAKGLFLFFKRTIYQQVYELEDRASKYKKALIDALSRADAAEHRLKELDKLRNALVDAYISRAEPGTTEGYEKLSLRELFVRQQRRVHDWINEVNEELVAQMVAASEAAHRAEQAEVKLKAYASLRKRVFAACRKVSETWPPKEGWDPTIEEAFDLYWKGNRRQIRQLRDELVALAQTASNAVRKQRELEQENRRLKAKLEEMSR